MDADQDGFLKRAVPVWFLGLAFLAQAGGGGAQKASSQGLIGISLPAAFRAFHPESPWNTPIGDDVRIHPSSLPMMIRLKQQSKRLKMDHAQWSIPLFVVDTEAAPRATVWYTKRSNPLLDPDRRGFVTGVPIPDAVWPDPRPDGHLLLIDPKLMVSWDMSRAQKLGPGLWRVSRLDRWDLMGIGVRQAFSGETWWSYGARGSGMPLIAGLVRPEQIKAGDISHALVFSSPLTRRATTAGGPREACLPASRSDGTKDGADTLPMGARLQLDPLLDLENLGLSPEVTIIARALQTYGMYNSDTTDEVFKIYLQNLGPDGGTWADMEFDSLERIPIERFRVLECDLRFKQ